MAVEFGTAKTVVILTIVVGCFAVLWPKLFYPMLQASVTPRHPVDGSQACCDVIFETDVNAIKIMITMCGNILHQYDDIDPKLTEAFQQGKLSKEVVETCRSEVLNKCGIDITAFLNEKVRLGKTYKQILDEIRSFNSSTCLKQNFGVTLGELGAPHRMRIGAINMPSHHRQERPPHLRPDLLHPALRERGRAIPQSHIVPRAVEKEGRPGPIPGMRPPMGGAGHVVPAPKGSGTMGIIMPIYTIGIVVFFMYTIMKVMFKKPTDSAVNYSEFSPDPEFRKVVFRDDFNDDRAPLYDENLRLRSKREISPPWKAAEENGTKLGDIEIDHLRRRLEETEAAMERIVAQMGSVPRQLHSSSGTESSRAKIEEDINEKIQTVPSDEHELATPQQEKDDAIHEVIESPSDKQEESVPSELQKTDNQLDEKSKEDTISSPQQNSVVPEPPKQVESSDVVSLEPVNQIESSDPVALQKLVDQEQDSGAKVKVLGMETTASCEGGQRWSRPGTPVLASHSRPSTPILAGHTCPGSPILASHSRPTTPILAGHSRSITPVLASHSRSITPIPPPTPEPQAIFLEGALPLQSQLLVSDSETQEVTMERDDFEDNDPPVILSGKMTLSLISLDAALAAEDEQLQKEHNKTTADEGHKQTDVQNVQNDGTLQTGDVQMENEEEVDEDVEEVEEEEEVEGEEEEEEVAEDRDLEEAKADVRLVNDTQHGTDEAPSTTNYTTASAAAEATNAPGPEETAADYSALESFGPDDEQQEEEADLEDEEGIWNGDVNYGEEEESEEQHGVPINNQQHQR